MVFGLKIPKSTTKTVAFKGRDPVRSKNVINNNNNIIIIIITKNIQIKFARYVAAMNNWMPKIRLYYRPNG